VGVIRRVVSRMNVYTQEMLSGFVVVKGLLPESRYVKRNMMP